MIRKWVVIGIVLLFVGTCIIPSVPSEQTHSKNIITVDDEAGLADYTSILDALNNSHPGDTIQVFSGKYNEHSLGILTRNLTLQGVPYDLPGGDDTGKPLVYSNISDKAYDIFFIRETGASINGFKLCNIGDFVYNSIIIIYSNNSIITGNEFNDISDIHGYIPYGILLINGNHSVISHNQFSQCGESICIHDNYNTVDGNRINQTGLGIVITGHHHRISNNTIESARQYGILLGSSSNDNITGNNIIDGYWGLYFEHSNSYNMVYRNNFKGNVYALEVAADFLEHATQNVIRQNNFIDNNQTITLYCPILSRYLKLDGNYYSHWSRMPIRIILGTKILLKIPIGIFYIPVLVPWFLFDWHPAKQPYDIPGGFQ